MSSIDKYVIEEAQRYNPSIHVYKRNDGQIVGKINGETVFSISDRYGYLNDSERSTIRSSIDNYEARNRERLRREQEERERRERERLERERVAARDNLKASINSTKSHLKSARDNALAIVNELTPSVNNCDKLINDCAGFNLTTFNQKVQNLKQQVNDCRATINDAYNASLRNIESIRVSDSASTETYNEQSRQLMNVSINIQAKNLPNQNINQLTNELEGIKSALKQLKDLTSRLNSFSKEGQCGEIIANTLKEIKEKEISSLDDIKRLMEVVTIRMENIKNDALNQKLKLTGERSAVLNGILRACYQTRDNIINQTYTATTYSADIDKWIDTVQKEYLELGTSAYTTCQKNKFEEVNVAIKEAITSNDERALNNLKSLHEEYLKYKTDDDLQADNYKDYMAKVKELVEKGVSVTEIEAFNPFEYDKQKQKLNKELLNHDYQEAISNARNSFLYACEVMHDMGYEGIKYDFGSLDEGDETVTYNENALACEGIFAIPGCEGVVLQIIATENGIMRRVIGVLRTNGTSTSVARVMEVAKKIEDSGEIDECFGRYSEIVGGIQVVAAVDSDTEGAEEAIKENGVYILTEETESKFNKVVASGTEENKKMWESKISTQHQVTRANSYQMDSSMTHKAVAQHTAEAKRKKRS